MYSENMYVCACHTCVHCVYVCARMHVYLWGLCMYVCIVGLYACTCVCGGDGPPQSRWL